MQQHRQLTKHFNSREFDSPDLLYSGLDMDMRFMKMLERARVISGVPFHINSGFRTRVHNTEITGSPNSSHLRGYAADIKVKSSSARFLIITALLIVGFKRIGIAVDFIHVDNDPLKIQELSWFYKK